MFKSLKEAIDIYSKKKNLSINLDLEEISRAWKEAVGERVYMNAQVKFVKNQRLFIQTTTPVWRAELDLQKEIIIKKLIGCLRTETVSIKEIKFI